MHALDDFREILAKGERLAPHTWFRIGGPAEYVARPRNADEAGALVRRCREANLPIRVLGGGSNVLIRDEGVAGVVIHLQSPAFSDVRVDGRIVEAGAAVPLTALISQTARLGLAGLEVLTGIPGTFGGAVRGNSGGRHGTIGTAVRSATVLDSAGEIQVRDRDDLDFARREGSFDGLAILSAGLELETEDPEAVVRRMRKIWIVKKENQPYGHESSGCIFKSPGPDVAASALIDQAGLRGARVGGAEVSERHANYIVARRGATSEDVFRLIDQIRDRVRSRSGYDLALQIEVW